MPLPAGGPDFCRLLARGTAEGTPIVSRNAGDNYILVRIRKCDYRDIAAGGGKSSVKRREKRYPRKIKLGDEWYLAHSLEEERMLLLAYLRKLRESEEQAAPPQKASIRKRIKYTVTRLQTVAESQAKDKQRRIQKANNDIVNIIRAFPWI